MVTFIISTIVGSLLECNIVLIRLKQINLVLFSVVTLENPQKLTTCCQWLTYVTHSIFSKVQRFYLGKVSQFADFKFNLRNRKHVLVIYFTSKFAVFVQNLMNLFRNFTGLCLI